MSVLNPPMSISTQMFNPNVKDSRWLTLEVCREFQRTKCSRTENECKFAHPPPHVEVQNGRVTCCFDSIKGKCQRKEPPCKYLHPPQHLREQLLQNGRNNLILKNLQMQYIAAGLQPNVMPTFQGEQTQANSASPEYRASPNPAYYTYEQVPQQYMLSQGAAAFNPSQYAGMTMAGAGAAGAPAVNMQTIMSQVDASGGAAGASPNGQVLTGTKISRPDRLEVCREYERSSCSRAAGECRYAHPPDNVAVDQVDNTVTVCMDFIKGKCSRDSCRYFHPPPHLQAQIKLSQQRVNAAAAAAAPPQTPTQLQNSMGGSLPSMVPVMKRPALDNKSGIPMYQPASSSAAAHAYQQALAMQLQQQQQYVPVSIAGHPPSMPRF